MLPEAVTLQNCVQETPSYQGTATKIFGVFSVPQANLTSLTYRY